MGQQWMSKSISEFSRVFFQSVNPHPQIVFQWYLQKNTKIQFILACFVNPTHGDVLITYLGIVYFCSIVKKPRGESLRPTFNKSGIMTPLDTDNRNQIHCHDLLRYLNQIGIVIKIEMNLLVSHGLATFTICDSLISIFL